MSISVTPIPRVIDLATPAFTLGTSNVAGSAQTAVASNSTLLTFDATVPTTIAYGASAATGSATVAARRDHTHGMLAAPAADTARVAVGSYTGDGTTSQAITGVGFPVKHIMIFQMSNVDDGLSGARAVSWTNTTQISGSAAGQAVTLDNGSGRGLNIQSAIIALGSDGFTVDDAGSNEHPNKSSQVYNFTCFGY